MLQSRATRRHIVTYALLVAVTLILLAVADSVPVQDARRGVNFALSPIQETLARTTRSITALVDSVAEIDALRRDRDELARNLDELRTQNQQLEALRTENDRLAALLATKGILAFQTTPAVVIGRQSTQFERVVTLDRGTDAGIAIGNPVLSEGGALAGVVTDAGSDYSFVMLLNDSRSIVIGLVERSRATGEVEGRLSAPLAMTKVPSTETVAVEDTVVTAGLDLGADFRSAFPKGLLIGRVVDVQSDPSAVVQTALVQPAADLDKLEYVLVITDFKPPRIPKPGASPAPDATERPGSSQAP